MSGLVLELQSNAMDSNHPVSELLRKALAISSKLDQPQIEAWLNGELNGYGADQEIPDYRQTRGKVKFQNPRYGWRPIVFEDAAHEERYSLKKVPQAVAVLEDFQKADSQPYLIAQLSNMEESELMQHLPIEVPVALHVSKSEVTRILDTVRNRILSWALALEKEGVLGEAMTFSAAEREHANNATYQVITNNIGHMSNSQLQQAGNHATQVQLSGPQLAQIETLLKQIKNALGELGLDEEKAAELSSDLDTAVAQIQSPKPKSVVILEILRSARTILEGAAGSMLAAQFLSELSKYL